MKKLVGFVTLVMLVGSFALPALAKKPQGAARLSFSGGRMPAVDFPHDLHKHFVEDCKSCHHMGVGTGSCVDCHGGDSRARSKKSAFHDSCMSCHQERGVSKKKDCRFCHNG